ncbi:IdsF [Serratia fonticola]
MISWKRKTQHIVSTLGKIAICFLLISPFYTKAKDMSDEKYLFSFKSNKSACILRVNDFPAVDSFSADQRTMSAGFNLTAFLADGVNEIELLAGSRNPKDPQTLYKDSSCEVIVSKDSKDSSIEIARIKLSVNEKGQISANESTHYNGGAFNSKIIEGYTSSEDDYGLYKAKSTLILNGLPKWSWVKATPVTDNDLPAIRKAYEDIMVMINNRDIEGLKKVTKISNDEMGVAEGTSPALMFISTDFPQHVADKSLTTLPISWDKYKLRTYRGGRLFRFSVGYYQHSPLRFQNAEGKLVFGYNPYFSIIDGKVTLVR